MIDKLCAEEVALAPDQPTVLGRPKTVVRYLKVDWEQWKVDM
jgi:hypothetical protein